MLTSCLDHDNPKLSPIDTTEVTITASVTELPAYTSWLTSTEEMTVKVENVEMKAPKGVVLKSISLVANHGYAGHVVDEKPYSGDPLEFKFPLNGLRGRVNFSLRGTLIKKDSRDAEYLIADNIQRIVFSETPKFECEGKLFVTVKSKSTTGEEYSKTFDAYSIDHFTIPIPQEELFWTPTSGTASTVEVSLGSGAKAWSPNTTFDGSILKTAIGHNSGEQANVTITIPNTPEALNSEKLQMYVQTDFYGTWEEVTIDRYPILYVFNIVEVK